MPDALESRFPRNKRRGWEPRTAATSPSIAAVVWVPDQVRDTRLFWWHGGKLNYSLVPWT